MPRLAGRAKQVKHGLLHKGIFFVEKSKHLKMALQTFVVVEKSKHLKMALSIFFVEKSKHLKLRSDSDALSIVLSRLTTALSCLPACRSANAGSRPGMRAALASLLDAHGASQPVSGETPPQASPVLVSGLTTGDRHTPRVQSRPVRVLSPPRPSARSRTAPAVPATVPQCGRPILLQRGCAHRVADVPYTVSVRMLYPGRACGQPNA